MPELPEVETVRRVLASQLCGRQIDGVDIVDKKVVAHPEADNFCRALKGEVIDTLSRRGKFLIIGFKNKGRAVVHLRMTGCLLVVPDGYAEMPFMRLKIALADGGEVQFLDLRRFARWWYFAPDEDDDCCGLSRLGPEPEQMSGAYLKEKIGRSRGTIKSCLLDQSVVAGIGNIYSDEILHCCGISPLRPACSLSDGEWRALAGEIPACLEYFTEKNAVTAAEYLAGQGRDYQNTPFLRVYGRAGQPCAGCGGELVSARISGRTSVFCSRCQK